MEYRVLSRKWRPQNFEDVVGQDAVVQTLVNAIRQKRIAHAFIFSGPRGIGKTSIARIFSRALNCERGPTETPCNECANCREITDGIAIDVHEIDGASNRGIDEIRELRENVKFSPVSSRYKIYIIDEVHMLTREAFNALLKTLEEPPSHVIFIFATTETHKVPSTILSRCQCFDFHRISLKGIADNLRKICDAENIAVSEAGLTWIAEAADGSARDAQSILDQVISYAGAEIKDDDVQNLLGLSDRRFLHRFSAAVLEKNAAECLQAVDEAYYAGVDLKFFYQMLLSHFRNLLLVKILGDAKDLVQLCANDLALMRQQIEKCSRETIQQYLDILMAEDEAIRKSANPRLNLETVLIKLAYLEPVIPIEKILGRLENIERRLFEQSSGETEEKRAMESAAHYRTVEDSPLPYAGEAGDSLRRRQDAAAQNFAVEKSGPVGYRAETFRNDFLDFLRGQNPRLASKLEPGKLAYEEGRLTIAFPIGYIFLDDIRQADHIQCLTDIAKTFLGEGAAVKIESVEDDEFDHTMKKNNGNQRISEIKREALQDPLLQKVLDVFGDAEVREVLHRKNNQNDN